MSLKVGIIGTGVMGTQHAHLLAREVRGCEVVAIADINSARVSQIAHDLAIAATYQDGLDLIRSATVEAVLVASSDDTHFRLVSECIRHGKPVLCEKPLATTAEECRRLVDAEINAGKRGFGASLSARMDSAL